jgi:hypothetical protein
MLTSLNDVMILNHMINLNCSHFNSEFQTSSFIKIETNYLYSESGVKFAIVE